MSISSAKEPGPRFLRACRRLPVDRTPVWFMRQAGRYMVEYRAIRAKHSLLDICRQSELAAEVTLGPVQAFGVDAAILFADILLPLIPMGADLEFVNGEGPLIHNPLRTAQDVAALKRIDPAAELWYVMEAIRILRRQLPENVPLIGFGGGPFTLASYLIEGGSSRCYLNTKSLMYTDPKTWHALMEILSQVLKEYLLAQVEAGAQAIQLFDSWVGALSRHDYRQYVQPHTSSVLRSVSAAGVPTIHFGTGTAMLLDLMREAGGDVIGVDWRLPLDMAWGRVGHDVAIQGNLDPTILFAPPPVLEQRVIQILEQAQGRPGHIFNLGHGILPSTPVAAVRAVVEIVHQYPLQDHQG